LKYVSESLSNNSKQGRSWSGRDKRH
jgi:hypothetical protein